MFFKIGCTPCPTAPDPPTNFKITQASATSVTVSWTPPTNTTGVTGYHIYYTENGGNEQSRNVRDARTNKDTIRGLTTGSTYSVKIVAISKCLPSAAVVPKEITLGMRCHF